MVYPVRTHGLKERVNYFCLLLHCVCGLMGGGGKSAASESGWVSTGEGKGNASQSKVCSSNMKGEHRAWNRVQQGFCQNGSVDEDH